MVDFAVSNSKLLKTSFKIFSSSSVISIISIAFSTFGQPLFSLIPFSRGQRSILSGIPSPSVSGQPLNSCNPATKGHLSKLLSVTQPLNSGSFADEAELLLKKLFEIYPVIIAVGGSGLYLKALIDGVDELPKSDEIRKEISLELKEKGLEKLVQEIKERDPVIAKQIDIQNPVRVSRYLEILRISNKPISEIKKKAKVNFFETIYLGLTMDRELLYDRINLRTDLMIKQGLEEEAYNLLKYKNLQSLQTVGYKEWWDYFNHKTNKEETIDLIKQNSRNYAKRQITWFKNQTHCEWFEPKQFEQILDYINKSLAG